MIPSFRKIQNDMNRARNRRQERLRRKRAKSTRRSFLEQLDDRRMLAAIEVTTEADTVADDGLISLREAVQTANASHAADTITFADNVKTITFTDYIHLEEAGGGDTIIKGPVKLIPGSFFIDVQGGANVELSNVEITGASNGAVSNLGGALLIHDSTLHGNSSTADGGAVNSFGGHLIVVNSTISGNSARSGGGLWVEQGNATIVNSTVAFNSATDTGGGIQHRGGTVTLHSSIIAGNHRNGSASDLHDNVTTDSSNNLVGDAGSAGGLDTEKGNILGVNDVSAVIGPLTNVSHAKIAGHSVWTHLLQPNSPAIDAGDGSVFTDKLRGIVSDLGFSVAVIDQFSRTSADQRGNPRIDGCAIDIGALESVDPTLCVTNEDGFGSGSLAEAIKLANNNKGADTIRFAPGVSTIRWGALYNDSILKETGPDNKTTIQGPVTINFSDNDYGLTVNEGVFAEFSQLEITGSKGTGIDNRGQLVVHASTIHDNTKGVTCVCRDEAGGITARAGRVTVVNSTIANNRGRGAGGLYVRPGAEAVVVNSTITDNSLLDPPLESVDGSLRIAAAGGIFVAQRSDLPPVTGNLTIHNSIIAGNRSSIEADKYANEPELYGLDLNGAIGVSVNPDSRNNLVGLANRSAEKATQATTLGLQQGINGNIVFVYEKGVREISNVIGTTLQDGGKGIKYFDFANASPAINKGEIEIYTSYRFEDQRGLPRVSGNGMDIGAIELQVPEDPQTNTITQAPFEFRTTGSWKQDGTKRSTGGQVQIGFIPEQGKTFQPLLRLTRGMTLDDSSKTLTTTGRITALMKDNVLDIMHGTKQTATGAPTDDAIVIPVADLTAGYLIDLHQAIGLRLTNDSRHVFTPLRMQLLQGTAPSIKLNGHMGFDVLGGAGFRMAGDDFISVSPARARATVNYSAATKNKEIHPIRHPDSHPTFNATDAGTRFTFTNAGIQLVDFTKPDFGEFAFLPATNSATGRRHAEMLFDGGYAEVAFDVDVAPFRILNGEVSINASGVVRHLVLAGLDFFPNPDSDLHALSIASDKNEIVIKGKYHVTNENNKHAPTKLHLPHVVLSPPDDDWNRDSTLYIRNGAAQPFEFLINRNKREVTPDFAFGNVSVTSDASQIIARFRPGKPPSGDDPAIQPRFEVRGDKLIFEQHGQTAAVRNTLTMGMKEDGDDAVFIENGGVARIAATILEARLLVGGRNVTFTPESPGSLRVNYASVHEYVDPRLHLDLKLADDFVNTLGDRIWIEGQAKTEIRLNGSTDTVSAVVDFGHSPKLDAKTKQVIRAVPAAETSLHLDDWRQNTFGYVLNSFIAGTFASLIGNDAGQPRDYLKVTKRIDKDGEKFVWDGTYAVALGNSFLGVSGSVSSSETAYQLPASFSWNGQAYVNGVYLQHRDIKTEGEWESGLRLAVESVTPATWRLSGFASVEIEQHEVPIQLSDSFVFKAPKWGPNLTVTVGATDVEVAGINLSNAKISLPNKEFGGEATFESGEVDFQVGDIPKTKATVTGSMRKRGGGLVFNEGLTYELAVSEDKPIVIQDIHFTKLTAKSTPDGSFVFSGEGKFKNKGITYSFGPGPDTNSLHLKNGVFELKGKGGGVFEPFESEYTAAGTIILTDSLEAPRSSTPGGEGEQTVSGTLVTKEGEVTTIDVGGTLMDLKLGGSYTNKDGTLTTTTGLVIKDGKVEEVSGSVENSFTVGGVEITLEGGVTYNIADDTLELTGTATFGFETGTGASFEHEDAAGKTVDGISVTLEKLVIEKGQITEIIAHVSTSFKLFGIELSIDKAGFSYTRETEEYRFFGTVGLSTPATMQKNDATGELEEGDSILKDIKLTLGTPDAPGGLVIKGGELESISGSLSGSLNLYGATVTAEDLGLSYTRATNELQITGGLSVELAGYFTANASLPGGGILIDLDTGKVQVKDLTLSVGGIKIGTLGINSIEFSYLVDDDDTVTIKGSGELSLPGGLTIGAGIEIRNNKLKAIEFKVAKDPGLPLGHPPVIYLNSIEGKLDNLDDLKNFELTASVSATVGPSIMVFGESRSLAEVKGTFIYNHNGGSPIITLQGDVELAEGILGDGTAKLTIQVDPFSATLEGELSLLPGGVFSGTVHLHIDNQANVTFSGSIALKIPDEVPFIGGDKIGTVSVEVQLRPHEPRENSWFKAEGKILIVKGFVKIDLTGKVAYELKTNPFGRPKADGSFTLPGARDLDFLIPLAQGDLDGFAAHIDVTPPALTVGAAIVNADGTGTITYTGSTQLPDATTIDLFVDTNNSGYNGHLIASGLEFVAGEQLFDWQDLASYAPIPYDPNQKLYVYGKIYDGTNLPVPSGYSAAITPPDFTPTVSMPGARTFGVNQALVFSNKQQNAITVSDPLSEHAPDAQLVVELKVDRGILRLDPQQSTPWTNVEDPTDVDGSGGTDLRDALQLISMLNDPALLSASGQLPSQRSTLSQTPMYDVDGDGKITASDAARMTGGLLGDTAEPSISVLDGVAVDGDGTRHLKLIGTADHINQALDGLTYQPHGNAFFEDSLELDVNRYEQFFFGDTVSVSTLLKPRKLTAGTLDGIELLPASYEQGSGPVNLLQDLQIESAASGHILSGMITIEGFDRNKDVLDLPFQDQVALGIEAAFHAATGTLYLTGSRLIEDYQHAIALTTFSSHGTGPRTLRVQLADGSSNVANTAVAVHIVAMNQAPIVTTGLGSRYVSGNSTAVALLPSITVQDTEGTTLQRAVITLDANSYYQGEDVLTYETADNITGRFNALTGQLELSGEASPAAWSAALSRVMYRNTLATATPGIRQIHITVDDGNAMNSTGEAHQRLLVVDASTSLQGVAVGNLPTQPATEINDDGSITLAPELTLTVGSAEVDSLVRVDVAFTDNFVSGSDFLSVDDQLLGMNSSYDAMHGVLTITGDVPIDWYEYVLRGVRYSNRSLMHDGAAREITFTLYDGFTESEPRSMTAQFVALPVVQAGMELLVYETGQSSHALDANINVMYTGAMLTGATVEFTWDYLADQDRLLFTNQNGITGSFDDATGVLTLTGTATVAQYQAALRSVQYTNTRTNPITSLKQLDVTVQDGETFSDPIYLLLVVDTEQLSPTVAATTTSIAFTEGNAPVVVAADLTINEHDEAHESGRGTVYLTGATVVIDGYVPGEDVLTFDAFESEPDEDGDTLVIKGEFDVDDGVLFLFGRATPEQYQTVLRGVYYENVSAAPSTHLRVLDVSVSQGIASADAPPITVTVTSLNDPPTRVVAPPASATILENAISGSLGLGAIDYAPPHQQQPYVVLTVTNVPDAALGSIQIQLSNQPTVSIAKVGDVYTLNEIRSAVFVPALNISGTGTFAFTVAGWNPILEKPDPAHLTESIAVNVVGVGPIAGTKVLDNFATDQNFVDGKYTFIKAFNSPANNPNVSGGVMNPNFAPGNIFATGAWLWNAGERLSAVGDKASVTVTVGSSP